MCLTLLSFSIRLPLYDVYPNCDINMLFNLLISTFLPVTGKLDVTRKVPKIKDFNGIYRRIHTIVSTCPVHGNISTACTYSA